MMCGDSRKMECTSVLVALVIGWSDLDTFDVEELRGTESGVAGDGHATAVS